jgi:hypothetical protein
MENCIKLILKYYIIDTYHVKVDEKCGNWKYLTYDSRIDSPIKNHKNCGPSILNR